MNDKNPASLTSSLLARKGTAAPSFENAGGAEDDSETSADVEGNPVPTEPADSFLTRGPDPVAPDVDTERSPLSRVLEDHETEPSRSRRAPLIILAILLVFVLAGAGWFAASMFLRGGEERSVASATTPPEAQVSRSDAGLRPVASQTMTVQSSPEESEATATAPTRDGSEPAASPSASLDPAPAPGPVERLMPESPPASDMADDPVVPADKGGLGSDTARAVSPAEPPASAAAPGEPTESASNANEPPAASELSGSMAAAEPAQSAPNAPEPPPPATAAQETEVVPAPPPPRPPMRVAAKPAGTHGVQLASVSTRAQASTALRRLAREFASVLDGTALRIQKATVGNHGTVYRIRTVAILSPAEANRMCNRLKAAEQPCFVFAR